MKKYFLLLLLPISFWGTAQSTKNYSLELSGVFGTSFLTSFEKIDQTLGNQGFPAFEKEMKFVSTGGGSFVFRINRLGIIAGTQSSILESKTNANKHYYNGNAEYDFIGASYDVIAHKWFTLTPYITLGTHTSEVYLDYKFEQGVTPTSLKIRGKESNIAIGGKCYFRFAHWQDGKWQLFLNADANYSQSISGVWRFGDMRVDSDDFNLSKVTLLGGMSVRYSF